MGTRRKKSGVVLVILVLFIIFVTSLVGGYFWVNRTVVDFFGSPSENLSSTQRILFPLELFFNREKLSARQAQFNGEQYFEVSHGESVSLVCLRLEKAGLISDAGLLRIYLIYTGLDRHLKSGLFSLDMSMSPVQIAAALMDATPKNAVINILPGWRIEEVAINVSNSGLAIDAQSFIDTSYNPPAHFFNILPIDNAPSLEGFLFPGNYELARESNQEALFALILSEFSSNVDQGLLDGFSRQGLTVYDAVSLASIIQREAVVEDEKPLIASVFLNRLAVGMRLETDPTVQYALGFDPNTNSWWKSPLFLNDLTVSSPYNTYSIHGLPPTPISNPDLGSLRAVAFPAETPYYFFRAACDGSGRHNFAITFEEHLENSCD